MRPTLIDILFSNVVLEIQAKEIHIITLQLFDF